jgi:hypothetical protein
MHHPPRIDSGRVHRVHGYGLCIVAVHAFSPWHLRMIFLAAGLGCLASIQSQWYRYQDIDTIAALQHHAPVRVAEMC